MPVQHEVGQAERILTVFCSLAALKSRHLLLSVSKSSSDCLNLSCALSISASANTVACSAVCTSYSNMSIRCFLASITSAARASLSTIFSFRAVSRSKVTTQIEISAF
jgi:hypothetical protein